MIWFILIVNALIPLEVYLDKKSKDKGKVRSHLMSWSIIALIVSVSAWLFFGCASGGWILSAAGYFWIVFDAVYAKVCWNKWVFYGTSSWLDRQLIKLGPWHLVPKIITLGGGILIILFT